MSTATITEASLRIDPERCIEPLDWAEMFGNDHPVEVEIGIGKGRFLLAAAQSRPEVNHFGVEWANKYLKIAVHRAARRGLTNVRFARVDAKALVARGIPDRSVSAYYVFYPDPWPKKRHHKRRFFQPATAQELIRTLAPDGYVHVATDHDEYWEQIEPLMEGLDRFERLPRFGGPGFPAPTDEPLTNYEAKYKIEGRNRHRGSWRLVPGPC